MRQPLKGSKDTPLVITMGLSWVSAIRFAVFHDSDHRLLHYYMDRNKLLGADHRRPTFLEPFVTKPVVRQGTNRYQMKDMDMVFLQIPLTLL